MRSTCGNCGSPITNYTNDYCDVCLTVKTEAEQKATTEGAPYHDALRAGKTAMGARAHDTFRNRLDPRDHSRL